MKKIFILLIIVVLFFCGCKDSSMILLGEIVEINYDSCAILIKSYDLDGLVWVSFDEKFRFSLGASDKLLVGNEIQIKTKPEILESYPMQAYGIKITKNQPKR